MLYASKALLEEWETFKAIIYHPFTSHSNDVVWGTRLIVPAAPFSSASLMAYVFNTLRCQIPTHHKMEIEM